LFGEGDCGLMGESCKNHLFKLHGLGIDPFGDIGVAMPMDGDPPAAYSIDIPTPILADKENTFPFYNRYGVGSVFLRGIRVPDYIPVPLC